MYYRITKLFYVVITAFALFVLPTTQLHASFWDDVGNFFTETIPDFFTETIPDFFEDLFIPSENSNNPFLGTPDFIDSATGPERSKIYTTIRKWPWTSQDNYLILFGTFTAYILGIPTQPNHTITILILRDTYTRKTRSLRLIY
jgi:hypothetical protein